MFSVPRYIATAAVLTSLAALPAAASGATARQTIALLNAQRAANGLPAGIAEDPTLSGDCVAHDHYMALNHSLTHYEDPNSPGYTAGGAYAGANAVLSQGVGWDNGNPYEYAPLHLDQLLAPRLLTLGTADAEGFSCTTTFPGWLRPDPPALTVDTYPGNGAAIYASEVARERPWTPGQLAGIPAGARTGPTLIVLVDAPAQSPLNNPATLSDAILTGPRGRVQIRTVDGMTPLPGGSGLLGPYISPGGFIIPLRPLTAGWRYRAHVVVGFAGVQTVHDWSFRVHGADPRSSLTARGTRLSFSSSSPSAVRVRFSRPGGQRARAVTIRPGRSVRVRLPPGTWRACGHQPPTSTFAGFDGCVGIIVTARPVLRIGRPRLIGTQLRFPLRFSAVLQGRTATLVLTPLSCSTGLGCVAGTPVTQTLRLARSSLVLTAPPSGQGMLVTLTTSGFLLADVPWTGAQATARYVRP